jgi:hypothetical protein
MSGILLILSLYKKSKFNFTIGQLIETHPLRKCLNNVINEDLEYVITFNEGSVIEVIAADTATINRVNAVVVPRDTEVDPVDEEYVTTSNAGSVIEVIAAGTHMMIPSLSVVGMDCRPIHLLLDTNSRLTIRSIPEIDGVPTRSPGYFLRNPPGHPAQVLQEVGLL